MRLTLELVAHDLRSPVFSSRQALDLLLEDHDNTDRQLLFVVAEALTEIGQTLDGLLGLELLDDSPDPVDIDLSELARTCVDGCSSPSRVDVLTVSTRTQGHPTLLGSSILNLLENALRYTRTEVLLRAGPVDSGTLVMVEDDGPGIPAALRELVFQPRVRLEPDLTEGSGLGLALVRRVAELHGGRVWAEAAASGGARFCLWLP